MSVCGVEPPEPPPLETDISLAAPATPATSADKSTPDALSCTRIIIDTACSSSGCEEKLMIKLRMSVNTTALCRRSKLAASFLETIEDNEKENSGFVPGLSDLDFHGQGYRVKVKTRLTDLYISRLLWVSTSQRLCHDDSPASA